MDATKAHVPKLKSRMIFLCFLFLKFFTFIYLFCIFITQVLHTLQRKGVQGK